MKGFLLASLAALAVAAPSSKKTAPVTAQQLNNFKLYMQWSSASHCANEAPIGSVVTCTDNQCSMFQSHNATVAATFIGSILDMRGFLGIDDVDKNIVLSFRGSTSWRNWIADAIFVQTPCDLTPGCLVHAGFYASWLEIKNSVIDAVKAAKAAHPNYKLVTTGHSLGAAVATLAAATLRKAGIPIELYTYGSPRVGNKAFAEFVTNQAGGEYRLTHSADPIPRLPPIIFNYRHTSPEYWFDEGEDGVVTVDEFQICEGYANVNCNAATSGFNMDLHGWYFQNHQGCSLGYTPWRAVKERELSDPELEALVNRFAEMDKAYVENLNLEGLEP